jgi:hypothetical protein
MMISAKRITITKKKKEKEAENVPMTVQRCWEMTFGCGFAGPFSSPSSAAAPSAVSSAERQTSPFECACAALWAASPLRFYRTRKFLTLDLDGEGALELGEVELLDGERVEALEDRLLELRNGYRVPSNGRHRRPRRVVGRLRHRRTLQS